VTTARVRDTGTVPWSPLPSSDGHGGSTPVRLPKLLDQVLAGLGAPTAATIVVVHERWAEVIGAEVVDRASPVSIEGGQLRIAVDSPAWANHIRWSEPEILARLEGLVGPDVVTSVRTQLKRR